MNGWKLYEIINPSDPLTMYAPDTKIGGVAVALLGRGRYGIEGSPIVFGWDQWFEEQGISDLSAWLTTPENAMPVVKCLRSVALGSIEERKDYDAALEAITDSDLRAKFIADRNDRRRTSMNDIETRAHRLADSYERQYVKQPTVTEDAS